MARPRQTSILMRGQWLLAPLVLVLGAQCVPAEAGRADVPAEAQPGEVGFRMAEPNGTALLVPVTIGGKGPYDFVLDTGATVTCVGESLADELALPAQHGVSGRAATAGGTGDMRLVQIESLRVGATEARNVMACVLDLSHLREIGLEVHGLIGLNVLKNYRVTLDFERNVMQLDPLKSR